MRTRSGFRMLAIATLASMPFAANAADGASYEVTVTPMWTADRFPVEYPTPGLLTGPHFSGVIGASHDATFTLFRVGNLPSSGLERLSEMGKHDPLDAEIEAAFAKGSVGARFESGPNKKLTTATQEFTVTVDARHPMVSMAAMIAPSPDWFAGVADVNLMENGEFVAEKTVDALAYDAGGDDGTTYMADDIDNKPVKPTSLASPKHFTRDGKAMPVARVKFKRK